MPLFRFQFAFPSSPCILQTNNISISLKTNGQYFIFDYKASQDIGLIVVHKPRWSQTEVLCSPSEMLLNIFRRYFLLQIGNVDLYFQVLYWCCKKEMLLYTFLRYIFVAKRKCCFILSRDIFLSQKENVALYFQVLY